jgi:uncharacterized protein (TIGR02246 family)
MNTKRAIFLAFIGLGFLAVGWGAFSNGEPPITTTLSVNAEDDKGSGSVTGPHAADDAAIRLASKEFVKALEKGDPKAVAAFWTDEGEYVADDGSVFRGRAAIETAFAGFFEKNPKLRVELQIDSIHFVSKDCAIEEGVVKTWSEKSKQPASSRYSVMRVRDGGKWLMAQVREWAEQGSNLRDIDWLIGSWHAKTDGTEVRTSYEWDESKKFIRMRYSIVRKDRTVAGMEMIGRDPRTGQLHSWVFQNDGGFGEVVWAWDGKRWALDAFGVQEDGSEMTALNLLTPIDRDTFTWQSTNRTLDGDDLPSIAPVKVTRVK